MIHSSAQVRLLQLRKFELLKIQDCRVQHLFESRVALNPGLGGVRNVTDVIVSHEQTQ